MNWQTAYADKVEPAEVAVRRIRRGQHLFIGSGCAEPQALVAALCARAGELSDLEIMHILTLGNAPYMDPQYGETFRHNAFFIGGNAREAVAAGRADYTPIFLSEIPRLFKSRRIVLDVVLIQVSPPDSHGYCSLGVSVDIVKAAANNARVVIAEVNERMPRTLGDSFISVSDVDALVPSDLPILAVDIPPPNEVAMRIGEHIAGLIPDGATLQLGIGAIPNAVLAQLGDKRDLGVHTEMFSDGVVPLVEAGVITNERKTLNRGKLVTSFVIGGQRLFDFVDDNPFCEFRPTQYVNDPFIIAQHDQMVAINSALEVDLTGQVCADSLGSRFYSGIGGQVDFIRGAARSKGGIPVIALPSTAKGGTQSRIVPTLQEGAGIVTTRGDVHYVVTEWGVADLFGRSIRERALALIHIAHPDFRAELMAAAKARRFVYPDQIEPPPRGGIYPHQWETSFTAQNGILLEVRPVRPTDEASVRDLFYACSDESIYRRFMGPVRSMPHQRLQQFTNCDYVNNLALVALHQQGQREEIVAISAYVGDAAERQAEVAFLVRDDWHGQGLGRYMLRTLSEIAMHNNLTTLTAEVLSENAPMLHVFNTSGLDVDVHVDRGTHNFVLRLPTGDGTS